MGGRSSPPYRQSGVRGKPPPRFPHSMPYAWGVKSPPTQRRPFPAKPPRQGHNQSDARDHREVGGRLTPRAKGIRNQGNIDKTHFTIVKPSQKVKPAPRQTLNKVRFSIQEGTATEVIDIKSLTGVTKKARPKFDKPVQHCSKAFQRVRKGSACIYFSIFCYLLENISIFFSIFCCLLENFSIFFSIFKHLLSKHF